METTPITVDDGRETHPSWTLIRASRITSHPGRRLFDSEIAHREFVRVTLTKVTRQRDLHRDWLFGDTWPIIEIDMSMAQWGAFVSSFGDASGVPATLNFHDGPVPQVDRVDSRLELSAAEVESNVDEALAGIEAAAAAVAEGHANKAGRREMTALIADLVRQVKQAPGNARFAADSLTGHVENTVAKARADIEAMALRAAAAAGHELPEGFIGDLALGDGDEA